MHPALTAFGHGLVPAYEVMLALGACVLVTVVAERVARAGLPAARAMLWLAGTYLAAIAGARAAFAASRLPSWRDALAAFASPAAAGFASIGAMAAGGLAAWALARRLALPFARLLGPLVLGGCAFGAIARVGCFLAGCCHGAPTALPWSVVYPDGSLAARAFGAGVGVHPSPLYEAALLLAVAGVLRLREHRPRPDRVQVLDASLAVVLYLAGRFVLDFTRGDAARHAGLAATQWLALGLLVLGAVVALRESFAPGESPVRPRCTVE